MCFQHWFSIQKAHLKSHLTAIHTDMSICIAESIKTVGLDSWVLLQFLSVIKSI